MAASPDTPAVGHGSDSEGRVRAVAERARVKSLEIQPRAMGLPPDELGECARTAVNAAMDELRSQLPEAGEVAMDAAALTQYLDEVQAQGLPTMEKLTGALGQAMELIRQGAAAHGSPAPHGLQGLLEEAQRTLASVVQPQDVPDLEGTGEAAEGLVRAVAEPGGRIRTLTLERRAMRSPSVDLADHIVSAVNAALDELQSRTERESGFVEVDQEKLSELRETTMRQTAEFMRSLSEMIDSIQPR